VKLFFSRKDAKAQNAISFSFKASRLCGFAALREPFA
jgi:hypothetical protein